MMRRLALLWIGTLAASTLALAWSLHRHQAARFHLASEQAHLMRVRAQVDELRSLPATVASSDPTSTQTLAARVADVMSASGLPRTALESLSPESERITPGASGPSVSRRSASLTLASVTLPDLGRFLDAWRQREPAWTVTSVDLKPARDTSATGDLPLRVVLTLERLDIRATTREPTP